VYTVHVYTYLLPELPSKVPSYSKVLSKYCTVRVCVHVRVRVAPKMIAYLDFF
jgi:hypothetical protein